MDHPPRRKTFTSNGIAKLESIDSGAVVSCTSASGQGTTQSGSNNGLISLTELAFGNCVGPANVKESITFSNLPLQWNVKQYDTTTQTTTGTIDNVNGLLEGSDGCKVTFYGSIDASYVNIKGLFNIDKGSLTVATVNAACSPDLIGVGDRIVLSIVFDVNPVENILKT